MLVWSIRLDDEQFYKQPDMTLSQSDKHVTRRLMPQRLQTCNCLSLPTLQVQMECITYSLYLQPRCDLMNLSQVLVK